MNDTTTVEALDVKGLQRAMDGSWYTIRGAGGEISDWPERIVFALNEVASGLPGVNEGQGIGTPVAFYTTLGETVNRFAGEGLADEWYFQPDLPFLMFPLDGLDMGRLAIFRLLMGDTWFDDMIQNMRMHRADGTVDEDAADFFADKDDENVIVKVGRSNESREEQQS